MKNPITIPKSRGFSLLELLVVMAIVGLLAVLTSPMISSLSRAGNVDQAVADISLVLNEARAYAMTHNTYVWVGFASTPSQQLAVGVVSGSTGEVSDLLTGSIVPVVKARTYMGVKLQDVTDLNGVSTSVDKISNSQVGQFSLNVGGVSIPFSLNLQYSPQGEATIDIASGVPGVRNPSHWIQIGLQPAQGGTANEAVFQVAALSGQVQVFRK